MAFDHQKIVDTLEYLLRAGLPSYKIEVGEQANTNPDKTPWIGIYAGAVGFEPRVIKAGACGWLVTPGARLLVQTASYNSGREAHERMMVALEEIVAVLEADIRLPDSDGQHAVRFIRSIECGDMEVATQDADGSPGVHFNTVTMTISAEAWT